MRTSFTRYRTTPARRVRRARASLTWVCPLTWKHCSPSNPGTPQNCLRRFCGEPHSGFPPPLGKSSVLLKCGIYFSSILIKLESRIEIFKRRTVLTERRCFAPPKILSAGTPMGRGRRLDAHGARVYLIIRLACEVADLYPTENTFGGDPELPRLASGGNAAVS